MAQTQEDRDQIEYSQVLSDIQTVLGTKAGYNFIKYLIKNLDVGELPAVGTDEAFLRDRLGFLRAGNSVFKLIATASPDVAGMMLGKIERENYEQVHETSLRPTN